MDLQVKDSDTAKREIARMEEVKRATNEANKEKNLMKRKMKEEAKKAKRAAKEAQMNKKEFRQSPAPEKQDVKKTQLGQKKTTRDMTKKGETLE